MKNTSGEVCCPFNLIAPDDMVKLFNELCLYDATFSNFLWNLIEHNYKPFFANVINSMFVMHMAHGCINSLSKVNGLNWDHSVTTVPQIN